MMFNVCEDGDIIFKYLLLKKNLKNKKILFFKKN